jgi:uncharacterized sulfatase
LFLGAGSPQQEANEQRYNILWIYMDDVNMDLGTFGHPVVQTPALDALSQRGVRFTAAYCPSPVCNPSRVSVMTGLRPHRTGILRNETPFRGHQAGGIATLPYWLKSHGYAVGGAGKIFHNGYFDKESWDQSTNERDDQNVPSPENPDPKRKYELLYWGPFENGADDSEACLRDSKHTRRGIDMVQSFSEPFFVAIGYPAPHNPFVYPERFESLYDPLKDVPELPAVEQEPDFRSRFPDKALFKNNLLPPEFDQDQDRGRREATVAYWRTISYMDEQIGLLVESLEQSGRLDRTLIVVTSDHGWSNGRRGRWGKSTLFDTSSRVPLLICVPGQAGAGQVCSAPVDQVDLYPTLLELCGLPSPGKQDGQSLVPMLREPEGEHPLRPVFSITSRRKGTEFAVMVRAGRFKLNHWNATSAVELYDLEADPEEYVNLANQKEHQTTVVHLLNCLRREGLLDLPPRENEN